VLSRPAPGPDRTISYGPDPDQVLDLWPDGAPGRPLVVLVHGGFWRPSFDRVHTRPMAAALHATGWPVASLEYRRPPGDPDATATDVAEGLRAAVAQAGDPGVVAVGHSAGGHLVLLTGSVAVGVVALAPVADLALAEQMDLGDGAVRAHLGGPADRFRHLDPARLPAPSTPVTIVHGDRDERVPVEISTSYVRQHPGTRLVTVPRAEHFAVVDPWSDAWPTVVAEISRAARSS